MRRSSVSAPDVRDKEKEIDAQGLYYEGTMTHERRASTLNKSASVTYVPLTLILSLSV